MKIETFSSHLCQLGEGPVWDASRNEIYWIDIIGGEIHQYSFSNDSFRTYSVNELIGCIVICKSGELLTASKSGFGLLDRATGKITGIGNPECHIPDNRFNDGKCDVQGRLWAGTMSIDESPGAGNVYVFDKGKSEKKIENVTISNGLAWSIDNKTLYYIDTPTFEVVSYQYESTTGTIKDKKVVITIPKSEGYPDGMTIDKAGMLWIAHWDGWQVTRWNPDTGEKLCHIKMPVARITSCTFGGEHLRDLFITSARVGLSNEELQQQPLAGSVFVIRNCGYEGLKAFEFNN